VFQTLAHYVCGFPKPFINNNPMETHDLTIRHQIKDFNCFSIIFAITSQYLMCNYDGQQQANENKGCGVTLWPCHFTLEKVS
jgi:hypothetical protein